MVNNKIFSTRSEAKISKKEQGIDAPKSDTVESGVIIQAADIPYKGLFYKAVLKNAPNLLSAIPGVGSVASASLQTALGTVTDYYDSLANEKRLKEFESFDKELDKRLSRLEIKDEAKEYWEDTIVFKREDIVRKLMTEPGKGFDVLLAEYVASALSDFSYPPDAKDLILSTLLAIDSVDVKVLRQIDIQFKHTLRSGSRMGVDYDVLVALMKSAGIDSIMISRSIERLKAQDLIFALTSNTATLREQSTQEALLEGEKGPQHYSQGGFGISAFGRRFLRFLKLSD